MIKHFAKEYKNQNYTDLTSRLALGLLISTGPDACKSSNWSDVLRVQFPELNPIQNDTLNRDHT